MLDNLSSFRVHFVFGFFVLAVAFLIMRQQMWAGFAIVGFLASLVPVAPWYLPIKEARADGSSNIHIIATNIAAFNKSASGLVELVNSEAPELLGIVELTPELAQGLVPLHEQFPYRFELTGNSHQGFGLYSKLPLVGAQALRLRADLPPAISAIIESDGRQVEVIVAHPDAPMTSSHAERRNLMLRSLADHISRSGRDTIVLGDLNIAMWSPHYRDFVQRAGLRNARTGRGVGGSWPPIAGLSVPIDHILATPTMVLHGFTVFPPIGSDHLPIGSQVSFQ